MTILGLQSSIVEAKKKIDNLNSVMGSIDAINEKLNSCSQTLSTTGNLIGQAIMIYGRPSDNGKTAEIAKEVANCVGDFNGIIGMATEEINKLNKNISDWEGQIEYLLEQGRLKKEGKDDMK